ncbi:hypothetical protein DOK78_000814 [Enterococcus sp. DIV2402]|uniref:Polymerase nucleotidyl transferase domain-containing protein n=1 Tax=Candidatus Enterococcus lowellii TaxID=2230877 RepID=A0ABZ2SL21_9ENTE|nr:nucleotidyltransferase domain-containing protein [Enterococcus sp. DIV2402]MBO0465854.1 nucleotidyltransferase domain-containing protein [Enterococcus sp. DIV2402]
MKETTLQTSRNKLLHHLRVITNISIIQGTFLGGSLATGNADAYSDIDFRIVLAPTVDKNIFLTTLLKKLEPILFIETKTTFYAVIHFPSFIKLDVFVYYPDELPPSPWLATIHILKDTNELLQHIKEDSQKSPYHPTQAEVDVFLAKYYANLHEFYRRLKRQETIYAQTCRFMLIHCLISFWYMEQGYPPNNLGDWSKYEGARSKLTNTQKNTVQQLVMLEPLDFINELIDSTHTTLTSLSVKQSLHFDSAHYQTVTSLIK